MKYHPQSHYYKSYYGNVSKSLMIWTRLLMLIKSRCMRIGARHDRHCDKITATDGRELRRVDEVRYLGIFIVRSAKFKRSVDNAKRSLYRAANGNFAKVGRLASEEVILELLKANVYQFDRYMHWINKTIKICKYEHN